MKHKILYIIILIMLIVILDSIFINSLINRKLKDIPVLEKNIIELNEKNNILQNEKIKLEKENSELSNKNIPIIYTKEIRVPEYHTKIYGNKKLLNMIDDLENEVEELKERLEDEGIDDY